ncbi:7224_t:CDS:2, partial [Diversispora eburnea]
PEAKCSICKEVHTCLGICGDWSCLGIPNKTHLYQPEVGLRQYAIKHKMDPEKFSVITEAEKKRGIKRNEDIRKYHKFLTDQDRLIGEELLCCGIIKSGLSTAWLDDLMNE